ncbi:MAG: GAF domain-containing protein, partial [Vicinamibacterales bacterium]
MPRRHQAAVWGIWALLAAYGVLQAAAWTIRGLPPAPLVALEQSAGWLVMILLAALATRGMSRLSQNLNDAHHAHRAKSTEVEQLQVQNAMLDIIARSVDVPLAFQELAQRIASLVPCERVGLALLSENGTEFQTYTARVQERERRTRPRPEVVFKAERTAIGTVVRSRQPMIINDTVEGIGDYLDINVLRTAGFGSALVLPLLTKDRAVGTLNVVSRATGAFDQEHVKALMPVAEIFAVAYVAQQLQIALARHRTVESMSELTLGIASDIHGALQTITGHCDLIERGYPDTNLRTDLAVVVRQAQRISTLLDKMRSASHERLRAGEEA